MAAQTAVTTGSQAAGQDDAPDLQADNDNDLSIQPVRDEDVTAAGRHFIARAKQGYPVDIRVVDVPHDALLSVAERLEAAGVRYEISRPLLDALRADILQRGGSFARGFNAKPVEIIVTVQNTLPESRFNGAVSEVSCINSQQAIVAGATTQNLRSTISGTAFTSNEASVENVFSQINIPTFWTRLTAPTRDQVEGLLSELEAGMAAAVEALGGAVDIAALRDIIEELREQGTINAQIEKLVAGLIVLQEAIGPDGTVLNAEKLDAALADIAEVMGKEASESLVPPSLMEAAQKVLADLPDNDAVMELLTEHGLESFRQEALSVVDILDRTLQDIKEILANEEPGSALAETLSDIIAKIEEQIEAGENKPAEIMAELVDRMEGIGDHPAIVEIVAALEAGGSDMGVPDSAISMEEMAARIDELATQVENGAIDIEDLPPELREMVEVAMDMAKQGIENRPAALADHLEQIITPEGGIDGVAVYQALVTQLSAPEIQVLLPVTMHTDAPDLSAVSDAMDDPDINAITPKKSATFDALPSAIAALAADEAGGPSFSPAYVTPGFEVGPDDAVVVHTGNDTKPVPKPDILTGDEPVTPVEKYSQPKPQEAPPPANPDSGLEPVPVPKPSPVDELPKPQPPADVPARKPEETLQPPSTKESELIGPDKNKPANDPVKPDPEDKRPPPPDVPKKEKVLPKPPCEPGCPCGGDFKKASQQDPKEKPVIALADVQEKFTPEEVRAQGGVEKLQEKITETVERYPAEEIQKYGGAAEFYKAMETDSHQQKEIYDRHIDRMDVGQQTDITEKLEESYFSPPSEEKKGHICDEFCKHGAPQTQSGEKDQKIKAVVSADLDDSDLFGSPRLGL